MAHTHPQNFLRTNRKKYNLTQEEASHLVGLKSRVQFARYERCQAEPTLRVALACEQLFDVPTAQLFSGVNKSVAKQTKNRLRRFNGKLLSKAAESVGLIYKLQWIPKSLDRLGQLISV